MKKGIIALLLAGVLISGCSTDTTGDTGTDEQTTVVSGAAGEYSILTPFEKSKLRQDYGIYFREADMVEIGRQLQEKSKENFSPNSYYLSEGALLDQERYYNLLAYESDTYPYGLNPRQPATYDMPDGTVLTNPRFVSDIFEINFHKSADRSVIDGVSIALVLKRVQVLDASLGTTYRVDDDTLYKIGESVGLRLQSYLRTLDGMVDVPIYIGLYVQESDVDTLPGKYLPGYYIGHSYSEGSTSQFARDSEQWMFLNSTQASQTIPQLSSDFSIFKTKVTSFMSDENIGVIGKAFIEDNEVSLLQLQITTGSKTYLELYSLTQYVSQELTAFSNVPLTIDIRINQNTRFVVSKEPQKDPVIISLQ